MAIAGVGLAALGSRVALADPTDEEIQRAKARFEEGLKFEDSGDWKDALAAFQDVSKVKLTAQVRFKIAFSEEHLGRVLAATKGYREALELAKKDPEKAQDVLTEAPKRIDELAPKVPHLTVVVARPLEGKVDARVFVDGAPLDPALYGKPSEIEVGEHEVAVEVTGKPRETIEALTIGAGDDKKVRIDLNEFAPVKPPGPAQPVLIEQQGSKVPAIVVGSVGIAGLVASGIFLGLREAAIAEVRASCKDPEHDKGCDPKLAPVAADGETYTYVSASMLAVGVVGLSVGAALWFTVGGKHMVPGAAPSPTQSVSIGPGSVRFATTF
ncbi:MAG: hypothetical protein U0414_29390 [Polyangiaceae bacterium]